MSEPSRNFEVDTANGEHSTSSGGARLVLGCLIAIYVASYAKDVLLPLAAASLLALVLSPIVERLERVVGRALSSLLVVVVALAMLGEIGYFLTTQLTQVADEVAGYSDNIAKKITEFEKNAPPTLARVEQAIEDINRQIGLAAPAPTHRQIQVQSLPPPPTLRERVLPALPVLGGITQTLLTIVLMFFLLYDRKGLRDRLVRVAARGGIVISSQAIHDATAAVSWYLLLFSTINLLFGVAVALAAWIINVPRPMLWGLVAFVMRFLPYVGSIAAAALPTLVAFAVFPTSAPAFEVLASFVLLDQLAAQFAEPFLIGPGIGIAPVAYLISAIFWAWLWGPFGLLLSVPLTVCLKVAGDHIPELRSIAILLGSEERLEEYHDYYRNLLEMDRQGARQLAIRCCDELGLERTFNELFVPTLALSVNELAKNNITPQNQQIINETTRELIVELGDRFLKPRATPRMRVLGVCAPGEEHALGVLMLLELLRIDGFAANFVGDDKSAAEVTEHATRFGPDLLFVFCSKPQNGKAAVEMVRKIRLALPRVPIVAAGEGSAAMAKELLGAGCQQVMLALRGARRAIGRIALRRPRERQVPVQVENENYDRSADNPAPNSGDHPDLAAGSPRGSRQWLGRALSEVRHYFGGE